MGYGFDLTLSKTISGLLIILIHAIIYILFDAKLEACQLLNSKVSGIVHKYQELYTDLEYHIQTLKKGVLN